MMRLWLSKNSAASLREQLGTQLTLGVISGDLKPGEKLPSVRELARRYAIHSNTVSAAYRDVEARGWLEVRKGSGVYVRDLHQPTTEKSSLVELIEGFSGGNSPPGIFGCRSPHGPGSCAGSSTRSADNADRTRARALRHPHCRVTGTHRPAGHGRGSRGLSRGCVDEPGALDAAGHAALLIADAIGPGISARPDQTRAGCADRRSVGFARDSAQNPHDPGGGWSGSGGIGVSRRARDRLAAWPKACQFVITDVVTARRLPANCTARVFRVVSDGSIAELRRFLALVTDQKVS